MTRKSITYYDTRHDAMCVVRVMRLLGMECRVVEYGLGYAVQARKSGPYWNAESGCFN